MRYVRRKGLIELVRRKRPKIGVVGRHLTRRYSHFGRLISNSYNHCTTTGMFPRAPKNGHISNVDSATKFRSLLDTSNEILMCPGVYDGMSARVALSVGFDALYMVSITQRFQVNKFDVSLDRCRDHSITTRPGRSRNCHTIGHESSC